MKIIVLQCPLKISETEDMLGCYIILSPTKSEICAIFFGGAHCRVFDHEVYGGCQLLDRNGEGERRCYGRSLIDSGQLLKAAA